MMGFFRWLLGGSNVAPPVFSSPRAEVLIVANLLKVGQKRELGCTPKTSSGEVAKVDKIIWSIFGNAAHLEVSEDGESAFVVADQTGSVQVNISADADLGDGESWINTALDFEIVPTEASVLEVTVGEAEDVDPMTLKKKDNNGDK
jgi:hypothetical protein